MVTLERVTKHYDETRTAVDDLSLEVRAGELMVIVGPSGSGKSTVLKLIAGLLPVSDGRILISDRDVTRLPPQDRDIAMVFQNYALYPHMTVRDNLGFGLRMRHVPKSEIEQRVNTVADMLKLGHLLDRRPRMLSGGERQRVAMGRAIVREPAAFLLDEPLSNLDASLRIEVRAEIIELRERLDATMIYVTHDQVEAMTLGDRVAVMRDGLLQQLGPGVELYERPVNMFVASFLGAPQINLYRGRIVDDALELGTVRLGVGDRPELASWNGREVIAGIRPTDFLLPLPDRDSSDALRVHVRGVQELGSEKWLLFDPPADQIRISDKAPEAQRPPVSQACVQRSVHVRPGETVPLLVDPRFVYYFDPEDGATVSWPAERAHTAE